MASTLRSQKALILLRGGCSADWTGLLRLVVRQDGLEIVFRTAAGQQKIIVPKEIRAVFTWLNWVYGGGSRHEAK